MPSLRSFHLLRLRTQPRCSEGRKSERTTITEAKAISPPWGWSLPRGKDSALGNHKLQAKLRAVDQTVDQLVPVDLGRQMLVALILLRLLAEVMPVTGTK